MMGGREIVATGSWLYDEVVRRPVFVVRLDYDFWHEVARADGTLEAGEEPTLDSKGHAYYVSFKVVGEETPFWPDSGPHLSADEARIAARTRVPSTITWQ
ncbi:hypothetical protein LTV02_08530 [Nocardia yamanashiensis]|uniref:hypothetical protein n=1 Tax=Nocardia yamanashiensis TaxID=209247 RepID=UPI001E524DBE|nr:hypothetical protein [Nocardia yamanashiensis]UGT43416.1 hypothetical protein LTV02_08530 [Nocardia yamanashiensis]